MKSLTALLLVRRDTDSNFTIRSTQSTVQLSLRNYQGFADSSDEITGTEDTRELIAKLKSNAVADTLIVTSIQKMSRIKESDTGMNSADLGIIRTKRLVFIKDEAHRSIFGDMLIDIKKTFPRAFFFKFTGPPIYDENQKKMNTIATILGNELHRYTIAGAIPDKNVLGFDPYQVLTYRDKDLRAQVALREAKASSPAEAIANPEKAKVYYRFMDSSQVPMSGFRDNSGTWAKGIEDFILPVQYNRDEHRKMVVQDIRGNWLTLSRNSIPRDFGNQQHSGSNVLLPDA